MKTRVIVRKTVDPDSPVIWIELPDGTAVGLGDSRKPIRVRQREPGKTMFDWVAEGRYGDWEDFT